MTAEQEEEEEAVEAEVSEVDSFASLMDNLVVIETTLGCLLLATLLVAPKRSAMMAPPLQNNNHSFIHSLSAPIKY